MRIFLTGYRGAGKSAVGAALARRLDYEFVDTDNLVQQQAQQSIADLFARHGEEHFRDIESAVLRHVVQRSNAIIALGGGAVLRAENRELIRESGTVVWLRATVATLQQRLATDPHTKAQRPNLSGQDVLQEIAEVLSQRTPIYEACANFVVDADSELPEALADVIIKKLPAAPNENRAI